MNENTLQKTRMPHKELSRIADVLGVQPSYLSRILNCHAAIGKNKAILFSKILPSIGYHIPAEDWLFSQQTIKKQILEQYEKKIGG